MYAWDEGWKLLPEKKRPREASVESESAFQPIHEEEEIPNKYTQYNPSIGDTTLRLAQLKNGYEGLEAWLISEDEPLWFRVHLSKKVYAIDREITSLFRRLRPPLPDAKPMTWKTSTVTYSVSELLAKSLVVGSSSFRSVKQANTAHMGEPFRKKTKTDDVKKTSSVRQTMTSQDVPSCQDDGLSTKEAPGRQHIWEVDSSWGPW